MKIINDSLFPDTLFEVALKRIGLFGGTFNPIHMGHMRSAVEVKAGFALDRICFIPSALPPHKNIHGVADATDRFTMIRLAFGNDQGFEVSDIEFKRFGLSYSIDTITHFKSLMSADTSFFFILGVDAFLEIETWKSYKKLFDLTPFIVLSRPNQNDAYPTSVRKKVEAHLHCHVSNMYQYSNKFSNFTHPHKNPVFLSDVTLMDISSSKIRRLVKTGHSIQFLVPEKINNYIKKQGLYL